MNEVEQRLADSIYEAMNRCSNYSPRALQGREFQIGISDLGFCQERVRRVLDKQIPDDTDALAAFIGTAIGDHVERAVKLMWPDALVQSEVEIVLEGEQRTYRLPGHPDIVIPDERLMLDVKTDDGLSDPERNGPTEHQQFQRHMYGLAALAVGLFPEGTQTEDVLVGNVWVDRAARDKRLHVDIEPLNMDIVRDAGAWLDDVVYAFLNGEEARKDPPREMCEKVCGFFKDCRLYDTDVSGLITDEGQLDAVSQYVEGQDLEREGRRLKDQAKVRLDGVSGSTGQHMVRWTWVNPTLISEYTRSGYSKLDVRTVKRSKR